jgi:hypothetical protein
MVGGVGQAAAPGRAGPARVPRLLVVAGAIGIGLLVLSALVDFVFFAGRDVSVKDIPQVPGLPSLPSLPSGFPTGFPTELPSGFPTSLPGNPPSGFPTTLPSGFPTTLPTGFPQPPGTP